MSTNCQGCKANPVAVENLCIVCWRDKLAADREKRAEQERRSGRRQRKEARRQRDDGRPYIGSAWSYRTQRKFR